MLAVDRYSKHDGIPAILHSRDGGKSWSNAMRKSSCRRTPRVYLEMWLFNASVEQYHDRLAPGQCLPRSHRYLPESGETDYRYLIVETLRNRLD